MLHLINHVDFAAPHDPRFRVRPHPYFDFRQQYRLYKRRKQGPVQGRKQRPVQDGGKSGKSQALFEEAEYAGEKVLILQPTNIAWISNAAKLLATTLRKNGVKAELAPSDGAGPSYMHFP